MVTTPLSDWWVTYKLLHMVTTPLALIPQTKTTATTNQSDHQSNYHQNESGRVTPEN